MAALLTVCLVTVFIADGVQQRRFRNVDNAYSQMETGNYAEARDGFNNYLSTHAEHSLYWSLIEKVNGVDSCYTYKNVLTALSECNEG